MDKLSHSLLQLLHPRIRQNAVDAFAEVERALSGKARCRVTSTLRTFSDQAKLFAQGRTQKGAIVTNAQPGHSFHNYGLALDFALIVDMDGNGTFETTSWDTTKDYDKDLVADWREVADIFKHKEYSFSWGGDWAGGFKDFPHLENSCGYTLSELLALHNKGKVDKAGYVLL